MFWRQYCSPFKIIADTPPSESPLDREVRHLYQKNVTLTKQSETLNCDLIQLKQKYDELDQLHKELEKLNDQIRLLQPDIPLVMNVVYELYRMQKNQDIVVTDTKADSLRKMSTRTYYLSLLEQVKAQCKTVSLDLIYKLINVHSIVIQDACRNQQLINIRCIDYLFQHLLFRLADLEIRNNELRLPFTLLEVDTRTEKMLLGMLQTFIASQL